ncbi:MAG: glycosyltransferase [Proteobacteria bacterium]|nr:glycosyltransferase [Pseudomonadota bacterium]MBU1593917.1 glycosyltransferase [Pseudomonadota bacterium]
MSESEKSYMCAYPRISVIIPCFNAFETILACIESVFATAYYDFEVIVVDDKSTDSSREIVAGLAKEHAALRLITMGENGGPAKARNEGARKATGDILFFLDSDTEMLSDTLEKTAFRMQTADVVVGIYAAESLNRSLCPRYKGLLNYYFFSRKGVIPYEVFDASRAAIKAEIFHREGGFNESLAWGMDYENEEFGYRLCGKYAMVLDPEIQVRHHFPEFNKMTRDYFCRVALWMAIFLKRKRFESGGVTTGGVGASSAALLGALGSLVLIPAHFAFGWLSLLSFGCYLAGYVSFFSFVWRQDAQFLPAAIVLNMYFTMVIACGAAWGLCKALRSAA